MFLTKYPFNTELINRCYDCLKIDLHGISKQCYFCTSKMDCGSIYYAATF